MKRCDPGTPDATTITSREMVSERDRCRIVSVTARSATRWLVEHVCTSRPGRHYGWTFFRDGELLYLAQVGTFSFTGEEAPRRPGPDVVGCYSRVYDRAHLAKRPDQLVTSMRLLVTDDDGFKFALRVTLRGREDVLSAAHALPGSRTGTSAMSTPRMAAKSASCRTAARCCSTTTTGS